MGLCGLHWSDSGWGQVEGSCECGNEPSGSIKFSETIECLHNGGLSGSAQLHRARSLSHS
jgi:hypothetical protein